MRMGGVKCGGYGLHLCWCLDDMWCVAIGDVIVVSRGGGYWWCWAWW